MALGATVWGSSKLESKFCLLEQILGKIEV